MRNQNHMLRIQNFNDKINPIHKTEKYMSNKKDEKYKAKQNNKNNNFEQILNEKLNKFNFLKGNSHER